MIFFIIVVCVFLICLLFPLLIGRFSVDPKKKNALYIRSDNVKDPRYFADSFTAMMDKALSESSGDTIKLSHEEKLLRESSLAAADGPFTKIVYSADTPFSAAAGCVFEKEIFSRRDAVIGENSELRAIACSQRLTLQKGVQVERWADGERGLSAAAGCKLGISASSREHLSISADCAFKRLYAPEISFGGGFSPEKERLCRLYHSVSEDITHNPKSVDRDSRFETSVVTRKNFSVGENSVVSGSIKSRKNVRLKKSSIVTGNVFADGDIVLEEGAQVYGHIFSQESVYIAADCGCGRRGQISSVIAREGVTISEKATVFGYIGAEGAGRSVTADEYYRITSSRY